MSLYKRNEMWWVRFTSPHGTRIRRSTGTRDKKLAREYHDRLKAEMWRMERLGERPRRQWQEAVIQWLKEASHKKSYEKDKERLKWLDIHLRGVYLDEITRERVETIAHAREVEGSGPSTVNRYLALIRAILRKARDEWQWIDHVPKVRMRKEPTKRIRFLSREEVNRLFDELPEHLEAMARFALATGLRMSNVVNLSWSQVDLDKRMAWIHPDQSKSGKAMPVPLNTDAVHVLEGLRGTDQKWVFTYEGKPVKRASNHAWYKALKRAGIDDFRWHDLRHTWASWHAQSGTPLTVLQELGGWSGPQMVQRYAHLSIEHLAPYAEKISSGTNTAQSSAPKTGDDC